MLITSACPKFHCKANEEPHLWACWSQESSTGGGAGVDTVLVLISPMIARASFRAWYMRSISSRLCACSADSSIRVFWSSEEYKWARSSALINSFTYFIAQNKCTNKQQEKSKIEHWTSTVGDPQNQETDLPKLKQFFPLLCLHWVLVVQLFVRFSEGLKTAELRMIWWCSSLGGELRPRERLAYSWAEQLERDGLDILAAVCT